ncbi:2-hydroxyacid dehydrogenase [Nocardia sp. NPDC051750]|uniref:2-hydroxyacid dehydrogenase n=1 Tax=Nocardia sp. NPDC051750 TaxID=3364325 RepID=UPI0037B0CD50
MHLPVVLTTSPADIVVPVHRKTPGLPGHELRVLDPRSPEELLACISEADFLVGDWAGEIRLDRRALEAARRCRLIVQPTAGYDSIDVEAARELGIPVVNAPGANARAVAEWTVMAMLMLVKNALINHERTVRGEWWMLAAADEGVRDLGSRTVGILGMGRIGQGVARRLHAFGVERILYHHRSAVPAALTADLPLERVPDVDELCARSDVLTIHVPLAQDTRHLIDRRRLRLLGPDGVLVNTARGAVVDEDALHAALVTREIRAAALDVFAHEPLTGPHRWAQVDNVFLSPHLAGSTVEARAAMVGAALRALDEGLRGVLPGNVVNDVGALRAPNG